MSDRKYKILIVVGVFEELQAIISGRKTRFNRKNRSHDFQTDSAYVMVYSSGPGLRNKRKLKQIIEYAMPDAIINAGFVGVLRRKSYKPGQQVPIATVQEERKPVRQGHPFPPALKARPGDLVRIEKPLFEPDEKLLLADRLMVDVCDMESYVLEELLDSLRQRWLTQPGPESGLSVEKGRRALELIYCKIAGDVPDDYWFYGLEQSYRIFRVMALREKIAHMAGHPGEMIAFLRLMVRKRFINRKLRRAVDSILAGLQSENDRQLE